MAMAIRNRQRRSRARNARSCRWVNVHCSFSTRNEYNLLPFDQFDNNSNNIIRFFVIRNANMTRTRNVWRKTLRSRPSDASNSMQRAHRLHWIDSNRNEKKKSPAFIVIHYCSTLELSVSKHFWRKPTELAILSLCWRIHFWIQGLKAFSLHPMSLSDQHHQLPKHAQPTFLKSRVNLKQ